MGNDRGMGCLVGEGYHCPPRFLRTGVDRGVEYLCLQPRTNYGKSHMLIYLHNRRFHYQLLNCYRPQQLFQNSANTIHYSELDIFLCAWNQCKGFEGTLCLNVDRTIPVASLRGEREANRNFIYDSFIEEVCQDKTHSILYHEFNVLWFLRKYLREPAITLSINAKRVHMKYSPVSFCLEMPILIGVY